jgi:hypothetical protein
MVMIKEPDRKGGLHEPHDKALSSVRFYHQLHLMFVFIDGLETFDISVQGIFMFTQTEHRSTKHNAVSETARFMTTQAL